MMRCSPIFGAGIEGMPVCHLLAWSSHTHVHCRYVCTHTCPWDPASHLKCKPASLPALFLFLAT